MGIDWLGLTTYNAVDQSLMEEIGDIRVDEHRRKFYKYMCTLGTATIMWRPHKFSEEMNLSLPHTKIDIYPKHFESFSALTKHLLSLFGEDRDIPLSHFNISRIDLASDVEDCPIDVVLSSLYAMGFRRSSVTIYKGSTIYIGSRPKIRIYDKTLEILSRRKKGFDLTEWENNVIDTGKQITRFEIQLRNVKRSLQDFADDPESWVSNFDRIEFYDFDDKGRLASMGGLQILMSKIRRDYRKKLEEFKNHKLKKLVVENYLFSIKNWFDRGLLAGPDEIPF